MYRQKYSKVLYFDTVDTIYNVDTVDTRLTRVEMFGKILMYFDVVRRIVIQLDDLCHLYLDFCFSSSRQQRNMVSVMY